MAERQGDHETGIQRASLTAMRKFLKLMETDGGFASAEAVRPGKAMYCDVLVFLPFGPVLRLHYGRDAGLQSLCGIPYSKSLAAANLGGILNREHDLERQLFPTCLWTLKRWELDTHLRAPAFQIRRGFLYMFGILGSLESWGWSIGLLG